MIPKYNKRAGRKKFPSKFFYHDALFEEINNLLLNILKNLLAESTAKKRIFSPIFLLTNKAQDGVNNIFPCSLSAHKPSDLLRN